MSEPGDLSASLTFQRGVARVSLEKVALLEAIAALGSISAAARQVGLSYKGAWDTVQAMNNLFDGPLIEAAPGGRAGGAAVLTPRGEAVVAAFSRVKVELQATLAKLDSQLADGAARDLFWSLGMRTSARNALRGVVGAIAPGAVSAEVALILTGGLTITATLTRRSVEDLELAVGKPAIALIKANFVGLAAGDLKPPARNRIPGIILQREDGAGHSEIALDIGAGKTLISTITTERAESLGLGPSVQATALIKPAHVILAVE